VTALPRALLGSFEGDKQRHEDDDHEDDDHEDDD
jgi:hypothetical protein